jgi:hypothetical protein
MGVGRHPAGALTGGMVLDEATNAAISLLGPFSERTRRRGTPRCPARSRPSQPFGLQNGCTRLHPRRGMRRWVQRALLERDAGSRLGVDALHDSEPGLVGIAFQGKEREMGGGLNGDGVGFVGEMGLAELVKARRGR